MNRSKYNNIPNCTALYVKLKREFEVLKMQEEFDKTKKVLINASEEKKRELIRMWSLKDE